MKTIRDIVSILLVIAVAGVIVLLASDVLRTPNRKPQAVAYAKAIAYNLRQRVNPAPELLDVKHVSGSIYLAEFDLTCYLIDLDHPVLDAQTNC